MTLHSSLSLSRPQHCSQRSQGLNSFVSLSIAPTQLAQLHARLPSLTTLLACSQTGESHSTTHLAAAHGCAAQHAGNNVTAASNACARDVSAPHPALPGIERLLFKTVRQRLVASGVG